MILGNNITWSLKLNAPREKVFNLLTTDDGRSSFWAESTEENDGKIKYKFPNGQEYTAEIISREDHSNFNIDYFDNIIEFHLEMVKGCTILNLSTTIEDPDQRIEVNAGWVSGLISLKCACDFQVDLRNHDKDHCRDQGFVEN